MVIVADAEYGHRKVQDGKPENASHAGANLSANVFTHRPLGRIAFSQSSASSATDHSAPYTQTHTS